MKYKFDDNNIVIGHIKELLHSFNLPMIPVYTNDTVLYKDRSYIKEDKIFKWNGEDFEFLADYIYDHPIVNITKRLEMNSSIYDKYTHEYLGDYLRFVRDYHKVNLMSLYNCFSGERPYRIFYDLKLDNGFKLKIDTDNTNYNYYITPIKFNKVYTVAMDSDVKWEVMSIFYSNIFIEGTPDSLVKESYRNISGSKFTRPFSYSTYFECAKDLWSKEKDLVLLFKIPKGVKSSIVVLEGDYTSFTNVIDGTQISKIIYDDKAKDTKIIYDTKSSLLSANLENNFPFADRLVEYLLDNAITPIDKFQKNIGRVQKAVYKDKMVGYYGVWDNNLRNSIYDLLIKPDITKGPNMKYGNTIIKYDITGTETEYIKPEKRFIDIYNDELCYVDKDVESLLRLI